VWDKEQPGKEKREEKGVVCKEVIGEKTGKFPYKWSGS